MDMKRRRSKKVVQLIKENNFENQCIVASMDKTILQKVKNWMRIY